MLLRLPFESPLHHWISERAEQIDDLNFLLLFVVEGFGIVLFCFLVFMVLIRISCF